jgi:hypothetical protein
MQWENWVHGRPLDIASTYQCHEALFHQDTLDLVHDAELASAGLERKAVGFFRDYLMAETVSIATSELEDQSANLQASAEVQIDGASVPFRQLVPLLASESDYDRRRVISDAAAPVLKQLNPILIEKEKVGQEVAAGLGFAGYAELSEHFRRVNLRELAGCAREFLKDTEELYDTVRAAVEPRLGIDGGELRWCDVGWLFRSQLYLDWFPAEKSLDLLNRFLSGIGIDLENQTNIRIDADATDGKNPRAVCFPLEVPADIRLSIKPSGGVGDVRALFHEMGHAQHFAHTTTTYFEFRQLGSYTSTEVYAFLFEGMLEHPAFLRDVVGMSLEELPGYLELTVFQKLFLIRRYAAKLLYELELHESVSGAEEGYRRHQSEATRMELNDIDAERYLLDVDPFFYSADYFRAWHIEAMLDSRLEEAFGDPWFSNPETLDELKPLWSVGSAQTAEELAGGLGYEVCAPVPLLRRLGRNLSAITDPAGE